MAMHGGEVHNELTREDIVGLWAEEELTNKK